MAKEYLKGKNKLNTTTARNLSLVLGKTSANPLENAEITFDFIQAVADQISTEVTGDFVTIDDPQTITAVKTHTAGIVANGGISGGASADIALNTDQFTVDATQGNIGTKGELVFTEVVASPATSSTFALRSKQIVHTTTSAATNVIAINIPVGAVIKGVQMIVSVAVTFTGGANFTSAWTASTQAIGGTNDGTKNNTASAMYDANAQSAVVSGAVETITITANAGTIDAGGEIVVTAWYEELTDLTAVA